MILYLDTSSLVKLYISEEGSQSVHELVNQATAVATSVVAYAEARAAFARKHREGELGDGEYRSILEDFERDWPRYLAVDASEGVVKLAGNLAEKHALRGFDSIHLASAVAVKERITSRVKFSCADQRLQKAVQENGLEPA